MIFKEAHWDEKRMMQRRKKNAGFKRRMIIFAAILSFALLFAGAEPIMRWEDTRVYQVYCLGDSITYGSGLDRNVSGENPYPDQLGQLLGTHYQVYNYGVGGKTLLSDSGRSYRDTGYIDMVKSSKPDIIIIMLGTNDSKSGVWDAEAYYTEYMSLVEELQALESEPKIYLMAPPRAFPQENGQIAYDIDNDVIHNEIYGIVKEIAGQTDAGFIDLYAVTEGHPEYYLDGVHPNGEGYGVLAQTIYKLIENDMVNME